VSRIPELQLRVQIPAEQITASIMLRQQDISQFIEEGVRRAVEGAGEQFAEEARLAAQKQIISTIESYFRYGPGADQIKAAVGPALGKVMRKAARART